MKTGILCGSFVFLTLAAIGFAGGEVQAVVQRPVQATAPCNPAPKAAPVAPATACITRDVPLPPPQRRVGSGQNEFYGPTYYYPSYHNYYQGLNPTYYPFYHPRLWPNYRSEPSYTYRTGPCTGLIGGGEVQAPYWDDYDNWVRGGRYEEHQ
jgi:hypothetical protein